MASSNISDWDEPLGTSSITEEVEEEMDTDECSPDNLRRRKEEHINTLLSYVKRMAYQPAKPPKAKAVDVTLSVPKKSLLVANYDAYKDVYEPKQRSERIGRILSSYQAITTEQLEQILKTNKTKDRRREDLLKRKQELYYAMLMKIERQCRTQYLNVLIKKFAKFLAHLATTMRIPPQLVDPYARMQRGIFCNILLAIGVQPTSQSAIYYNSQDAIEYDVCHRLAHALLSLIIKTLDTAASRDAQDNMKPCETEYEMDNFIKSRLMCAAEKKIVNERRRNRQRTTPIPVPPLFTAFKKCECFESP